MSRSASSERVSHDPIESLITQYQEFNSTFVEELDEDPSPLQFMRDYVARNRPAIIRGGASGWKAARWNSQYLKDIMGSSEVQVALTPNGLADAPTQIPSDPSGEWYFATPLYLERPLSEVIDYIKHSEHDSTLPKAYLQTQNDNLRHECEALFNDVPKQPDFARIAFATKPEAINFWLGNSHSTTSLHRDRYENIYAQILGEKIITLLPPSEYACVNEQPMRPATWAAKGEVDLAAGLRGLEMELVPDPGVDGEPPEMVPFPQWDPTTKARGNMYSKLAQPLVAHLRAGDLLYLPALWFHKVEQRCSEEGICCSVNYWYDMDFTGPLHSFTAFMEKVASTNISKDE